MKLNIFKQFSNVGVFDNLKIIENSKIFDTYFKQICNWFMNNTVNYKTWKSHSFQANLFIVFIDSSAKCKILAITFKQIYIYVPTANQVQNFFTALGKT